jgi:hypothetical protein
MTIGLIIFAFSWTAFLIPHQIAGGGLTLGHQWILNKRWSIEAAIGAGYARVHYDKYNCGECGSKIETKNSNYWGVTKAALSIIYFIK